MMNNELYHHGVLGMKWGVRNAETNARYIRAHRKMTKKYHKNLDKIKKYETRLQRNKRKMTKASRSIPTEFSVASFKRNHRATYRNQDKINNLKKQNEQLTTDYYTNVWDKAMQIPVNRTVGDFKTERILKKMFKKNEIMHKKISKLREEIHDNDLKIQTYVYGLTNEDIPIDPKFDRYTVSSLQLIKHLNKLDTMNRRSDKMEAKQDKLRSKINKLDTMNKRSDKIEAKQDKLRSKIKKIENKRVKMILDYKNHPIYGDTIQEHK